MNEIFEKIDIVKSNKRKIRIENVHEKQHKKRKQEDIDAMIINLVCDAMLPFNVVENPSFKILINAGFPGKTILDRKSTVESITNDFIDMKNTLKNVFKNINYICVTADCWTVFHRYSTQY